MSVTFSVLVGTCVLPSQKSIGYFIRRNGPMVVRAIEWRGMIFNTDPSYDMTIRVMSTE